MTKSSSKSAGVDAAIVVLAALLGATASAQAQTYPARPITIMFPYGPGPDLALRAMTPFMEKMVGQPIVVENRSGGNEVPAMQGVLNNPADGYTLGAPSQNFSLNPAVQKLPYENSQFTPITRYATQTTPFLVRTDLPAKNMQEFIAYAKANPGKLNIGAVGNFHKVSWTIFNDRAGIKLTQIPFRGGADVATAMMSGNLDAMVVNLQGTDALVKAGKVRIIAVTGLQRMSQLPNIPAIAETVPGFNITYWQGIVAKAGTPRPVIDRWATMVRDTVKIPEVVAAFTNLGYSPVSHTPDDMADYVKKETETLGRAAKQAGIEPE